jgi:hypothetical protein
VLSFDFITHPQFRESLESDYREMENCLSQGAWKAAQVMAGSIVEAVLIDYLHSSSMPSRTLTKDVLKIDLAEAIKVCAAEGVLSPRVAELCGVVRSFRNLIHPGRVVRTNEPNPNKSDAVIAFELVGLITRDVARTLQKMVGLTAEQVVAKINKDQGSVKMLQHLLVGFNENQRRRLLIDLLPKAYLAELINLDSEQMTASTETLSRAYRIVFHDAAEATKQACVAEFARIVREEDGETVRMTTAGLFQAGDIRYAAPDQVPLLYEHVLQLSPFAHTEIATLAPMEGIQLVLKPKDVLRVIDPLVRTLTASSTRPWLQAAADNLLWSLVFLSSEPALCDAAADRLRYWIALFKEKNMAAKAEPFEALLE